MITETGILADVMDKTRQLSLMYFNLLKDTDIHKIFSVEGKHLNSVQWIMAHLAVTENGLLLRCTGGEHVKIPWARRYGMGSESPTQEDAPPVSEILDALNQVHTKSLARLRSLAPEVLDEANPAGFQFMGENSVRFIIHHAIRHEGNHAGQLGWLCKLNGIKTI